MSAGPTRYLGCGSRFTGSGALKLLPIEKVIERAKASGFDAELAAASAFVKAGFSVNHNVYYVDKDEGKGREFDIDAHYAAVDCGGKPEITCRIFLCVEVKRTQEPFIFFSNEMSKVVEAGGGFSVLHWKKRVDARLLTYKQLEKKRPFADIKRMARSYSAFKDAREQHIKSAVLSAFKAALHKKDNINEEYSDVSHDMVIIVPLVVVDGPIYECFFAENGELTAQQVESVVYLQNYMSESYGSQSVRVVVATAQSLPSVADSYKAWIDDLLQAIKSNVD